MARGMDLLQQYRCPNWDELPNIDLYMDQVLTFLNEKLDTIFLLNKEKRITASMINNYVKYGIVDKPIKKKYNRTQIAYLYIVCLFKKIYSMDDISTLIKIQVNTSDIESAYETFCKEMENSIQNLFNNQNKKGTMVSSEEPLKLLQETIQSVVSALYVYAMIFDGTK